MIVRGQSPAFLLALLAASIVVIPLIGGAFLLAASRIAKIPKLSYLRCWMAYLAAYAAASIGGTLVLLVLPKDAAVSTGAAVAVFVAAIALHFVIVPLVLRTTYLRAVLAHSLAILAYGLLLALLLTPFLLSARSEARRAVSAANLHVIGQMGFYGYADEHDDRLPPPATYGDNGEPLLSWRVLILPQLGDSYLFEEFHLDEPWDSPHNKALLCEMPEYYRPVSGVKAEPYSTFYQRFVDEEGKSLANPYDRGFLVVEAGSPVPWTEPSDLIYSPEKPVPKLGGQLKKGFNALYADGHVSFHFHGDMDESELRELIAGEQ